MNVPKLVRELSRRKAREERGMVVAEGRRLVADVLLSGAGVEALLAADDAAIEGATSLLESAKARRIETAVIPRRDFDELADTGTPSGLLAVVRWAPRGIDAIPAAEPGPILVIDAVQDPGNVGTMIRTAHALGAAATVALDGTADVRNPKVVRGSMGSLFRHPVVQASWTELRDAWSAKGPRIMLAAMDGGAIDGSAGSAPGVALVVGSEGHGVRAEWSGWPSPLRRVAIPMRGGAESLNAAVAAGILLYEITRGA
jgi:TrmH family RNA methyltransferase